MDYAYCSRAYTFWLINMQAFVYWLFCDTYIPFCSTLTLSCIMVVCKMNYLLSSSVTITRSTIYQTIYNPKRYLLYLSAFMQFTSQYYIILKYRKTCVLLYYKTCHCTIFLSNYVTYNIMKTYTYKQRYIYHDIFQIQFLYY